MTKTNMLTISGFLLALISYLSTTGVKIPENKAETGQLVTSILLFTVGFLAKGDDAPKV